MAGKIFINYRRGDDPGNTGRLFDRLLGEFEPQQLFLDVDNIAPGLDFVRELNERVAECSILLAVIGKGWIDARDAMGNRRIDNPDDFVRVEIESALSQGKRVIPVLVGEAQMPRPEELPEQLRPLARRNAVRLTYERFRSDTQGLIKALQQALEETDALHQTQVEAARSAQAEEERQREEHAANERAKAQRELEEQRRQDKEHASRSAIAGLSAEQITKAEELANWEFIKDSSHQQDFRDHLARYPGGVCERMARRKLSGLVWAALGEAPDRNALASYLEEFPDGTDAERAILQIESLDRAAAEHAARLRSEAQQALNVAKRKGNADAFVAFLSAYPESDLAAEARALHAELLARETAHRAALAADDPAQLVSFLDSYPRGSDADQVRRRLRRLEGKPRWPARALTGGIVLAGVFAGALAYWDANRPGTPSPEPSRAPTQPVQPAQPTQSAQSAQSAQPPQPVQPAQPTQSAQLTYSSWTKGCGRGSYPNAKQVCFIDKDARIESGTPVVAAALIDPEGEPKKTLRVTLPLGMQLIHGTRVIIDQNKPLTAPYVMCFTNGCMADYEATPDMIAKLKNGQGMVVQAINSTGQPISLVLPLVDFAKAYDGLTMNQKVYEEEQRRSSLMQPGAPNVADPGKDSQLTYSPWTKFCLKGQDANAKLVCFTGKDARIESGIPVVAAVLIEPEGKPKKTLRVTLPLGMQLSPGTRTVVDQNEPLTAPYVICFTNGCMADYEVTPDMIAKLKKGQGMVVQAINSAGQPISLVLPLADFAKAYDGPPTDPKVFEEQQKKLQEELQRRADEARNKLEGQQGAPAPAPAGKTP